MHPVVLFPRVILLLVFADLIGWVFHVPLLTSAIPRFSTMKPNTALALGLLALSCRARSGNEGHFGWMPRCATAVALFLSCGTLVEYASKRSLGLDSLVLNVPIDRFGDPPGRMALGTALCLTLTGFALAFLDKAPRFVVWMLLTANVIAVSALLGFIVDAGPLLSVPWLRSFSIPTASCLLMLGIGTLVSRPERRPISFLFPAGIGEERRYRLIFHGVLLSLLVALPAVVAMRTGTVEALMTFMGVALLLYSAETWFSYRDSTAS